MGFNHTLPCTCGLHRPKSAETRLKMRLSKIGKKLPPVSEKTRELHRLAALGKSSGMKGKVAWNRGLPGNRLGHKNTEEQNQKIRMTNSKPEVIAKRMNTNILRYGRAEGPVRDTAPEREVESWLVINNVEFQKQVHKEGISVDFYIPVTNTCVFVDGCYWHWCRDCFSVSETMISRHFKDAKNTDRLMLSGYNVIRLRECKLKEDTQKIEKGDLTCQASH